MKIISLTLIIILLSIGTYAQVGINTDNSNPDPSSMLDVKAINKGILIPRMTSAQRTGISSPAEGLLVFDAETESFWFYSSSFWIELIHSENNNRITDTDGNTQVQVEKNPNEDIVRFDLSGTEQWRMTGTRLEPQNSGGSVYIGDGAGANDDLSDNMNVAIGDSALYNNGIDGAISENASKNVSLGYKSLYSNTTGYRNSAGGYYSLNTNTTGYRNTAFGAQTMFQNATGNVNTAFGSGALYSNSTGSANTAVGVQSLFYNTTSDNNTALGRYSMYQNTTGYANTATGTQSLWQNTTGYYNTSMGYLSLSSNTSGHENTAIGTWALQDNTTASSNTAVGHQSLFTNTTGSDNTAIGFKTLYFNTTGYANFAAGNESLYANTSGFRNTASGYQSMNKNTSGNSNTANGYQSLYSNTIGYSNTAIGWQSAFNNISGNDNTTVGFKTLHSNTTGNRNTAFGFDALNKNVDGNDNTAIGRQALFNNTSGIQRTAVGNSANSTGVAYTNNTGLGYNADCSASNQVRIGNSSVTSIGGYANWTNVSDKRFKVNVMEDVKGLSFIQKLRPVTYSLNVHAIEDFYAVHYNERDSISIPGKYDKEQIRQSGFIAQEVEAAARELGYDFSGVDAPKNKDDFYGLRYAEFVVPLVKAVQEQQLQIDQLQTLVDDLSLQLKKTEEKINLSQQ